MKKMLFCLALAGCLLLAGAALALDGDYDFIPDTGVTYTQEAGELCYTYKVAPGSYTIRPKAGKELGSDQVIHILPSSNGEFHLTLEGFGESASNPFKSNSTMDLPFFRYGGSWTNAALTLTLKDAFIQTKYDAIDVWRLTNLTLDGTVNIKTINMANAVFTINRNTTIGAADIPCTLNLNGDASFTGVIAPGFVVDKDLRVKGDGSLAVTGGTDRWGVGLSAMELNKKISKQTLTLESGTLTLRGGDGGNQINAYTSAHAGNGLLITGDVNLMGGTLDATGGNGGKNTQDTPGVGGDGIHMQGVDQWKTTLTVNGGTLRAKGGTNGGNNAPPSNLNTGSGVALEEILQSAPTMTVIWGEVTLEGGSGQALYAGSYTNNAWSSCVPGRLTLAYNVKDGLLGPDAGSAQLLPAADILAGYPNAANKYLHLVGVPSPSPDDNETQDLSDPVPLSAVATHADVYAAPGERAQIQVTVASGSGPFAYQWYKRTAPAAAWQKIPGATEPFYHTAPVTLQNDGYQYYCLVTDGGFPPARMQSGVITLHVTGGKASATALPATGDRQTPALLAGLAAASLAVAALLFKRRRS